MAKTKAGSNKGSSRRSRAGLLNPSEHLTRQIEIIHLSDIHFGDYHRYQPAKTAAGDRGAEKGIPKLSQLIERDLSAQSVSSPVIICITGDLTTTASYEEFEKAEKFVTELSTKRCLGYQQSPETVFLVPGNHDVNYKGKEVGERWQHWMEFANRFYGTNHKRENPWALTAAYNLINKLGIIVLTLNSCIYVQKDTPSEQRGEIDDEQLLKVKKDLRKIPKKELDSAIRIALIHHHPILIPSLVEPDRAYDAVDQSEKLLGVLHDFGFHLLLHGHKHYPLTFLEKTNSAFIEVDDQPMMVVAGGSAGSTGLPDHPKKTNCYNRITVKWHPAARQTRIRVETRGLVLHDKRRALLPGEWKWETLRVDDRSFYAGDPLPPVQLEGVETHSFAESGDDVVKEERRTVYENTRGNLPVAEVMPSLMNTQAYEVRFWIVPHKRKQKDTPVQVRWSAGKMFPVLQIDRRGNDTFCGVFNYWGPMLIQAQMIFSDGGTATAYVYARIPVAYDK
jgi:3',5'-cyclic AMP phosphodiesterase CpdA